MKQPKLLAVADRVLSGIESIQPFSERDAWKLYRLAALGEAFGWTVLILGIIVRHIGKFGSGVAVPVGGQIHGILFLLYFGVLAATYTSLRWSRTNFVVALLAGVPPYGSLLFEQWKSRDRQNTFCRQHYRSILLARAAETIL